MEKLDVKETGFYSKLKTNQHLDKIYKDYNLSLYVLFWFGINTFEKTNFTIIRQQYNK